MFILAYPSLIMIEGGGFVSEINQIGYANHSVIFYSIFSLTSLFIFYYYSNKLNINIKNKPSLKLFLFIFIPFLLIIFYSSFNNPNLSRFNIFKIDPVLEKFFNYYSVFFTAGYYYCSLLDPNKYHRIFYLCCALFTQWLMKSEFSGQIFVILIYINSQFLNQDFKITKIRAIMLILIAIAIIFLYKLSFYENSIDQFLDRVILQSHLFWSVVGENSGNSIIEFGRKFLYQISTFDIGAPSISYGLGEIMFHYSGNLAEQFLEDGVYFSGGYPAILIFYFGIIAAIFLNIIVSIIFVYSIKYLFYFTKYNIVIFTLFYKILALSTYALFYSGELYFISLKLIIIFLVLILLMIASNFLKKMNYV